MQSRKASAAEAIVQVISGFFVGISVQLAIFPLFGINYLTLEQNALITLIFSLASMARGYLIRRVFNRFGQRSA